MTKKRKLNSKNPKYKSAKELIADIKDRRQQVSDIVSQYFKPTKD